MRSRIFHAHVDAIETAIEKALPELKSRFEDTLTRDDVVDVIGPQKLMSASTNASIRASCASIRGSTMPEGPWIDVIGMYQKALKEKENLPYLGEGI